MHLKTFGFTLSIVLTLAACNSGGGSQPQSASASSSSTDPALAGALSDIQRAINEAAPGDTITIAAGEYAGRIVIRKSITLVGAGNATILRGIAGRDDAVIEIVDAADVVVADLKVAGPTEGVRVRNSSRIRIEAVSAERNGHEGIDIRNSDNCVVVTCSCTENASGGIRAREGSVGVTIDDCVATDNLDHGIEVRDAADCLVQNNHVANNVGDGLRLRDSAALQILDNTIVDNTEYGVRVRSTAVDEATLRSTNTITGNVQGDVRIEN